MSEYLVLLVSDSRWPHHPFYFLLLLTFYKINIDYPSLIFSILYLTNGSFPSFHFCCCCCCCCLFIVVFVFLLLFWVGFF